MVLQLRDHDRVALTHAQVARAAIAQHVGDKVQRLGGVFGKRDLIVVRTHKRRDLLAGGFVGVGGFLRKLVGAAVHRSVAAHHKVALRLPHPQRPL